MTTVKVQWLKSHPNYGYFKGNIGDIDSKTAQVLIKEGFIQILPGEDEDPNPFPSDLHGRDLLHENGFTLESIKLATMETLEEVSGIGKATAAKIIEFYSEKE